MSNPPVRPPAALPRRVSLSKLPPQYRASAEDIDHEAAFLAEQQQQQQREEEERQRQEELRRQELERAAAERQRQIKLQEQQAAAAAAAAEQQRKEELSRQLLNKYPRSCYTEVCGQEAMAPLPRLQSTTERAADRTRNSVHQFLAENCPKRADQIDSVMRQFEGREGLLVEVLEALFGSDWMTGKAKAQTDPLLLTRAKSPALRTTESLVGDHPSNSTPRTLAAPADAQNASILRTAKQQAQGEGLLTIAARPRQSSSDRAAGLVDDSPAIAPATSMLTPPLPPALAYYQPS
jgi:hypothetical protein